MSNQAQFRMLVDAAQSQLDVGPREWPGSPSRQRLEFFLSASPGVILGLLDELEDIRSRLWKTYVNGVGKHDSSALDVQRRCAICININPIGGRE